MAQRVKALEAFLADVYGSGQILDDRIVPRRLVTTSAHFHRAAFGIEPANGVRIHVAGIDVVRGGDGRFYVLEDNIRCPSGISYVVENRRMMARIFPELFASHRVLPVDGYPAQLLEALRAAAPPGVSDPTVVVLTPGVYNSAYFEHSFLARQMGVELVEGRDLICRGETVYMRTTEGEQRVDVVYRRIDDDFLDPLHFRPDSLVGCPGILNAARAGNVTIANAVGNGVADDKLAYTYVPDMIRYYLGEEPILPNVDTYRLEDPDQLAHVLEPPRPAGPQAGRRFRRLRHPDRPPGQRRGAGHGPRPRSRPTRGRGSPRRSCRCRPPRPAPATAWRPAISTCARSPSTTASRSGSCPAA